MESDNRKKGLKGSVLFTVLCVMMVVLVLMITTIGLSGIASRRAYSEYYDSQVVSTGKSVISSVLTSLQYGNENEQLGVDIYKEVAKKYKNGDDTPYSVYIEGGGNLGNGLGVVEKIDFSCAGFDNMSGYLVKNSGYMIMKVTATVRMGSETTTYTEYVSDMETVPGGGGGDGGLISTTGIGTTGAQMLILGPTGKGLNTVKTVNSTELTLAGEGAYSGVQFFDSPIRIETSKAFIYGQNFPAVSYSTDDLQASDYQGMFVLGDLTFNNSGYKFVSKYNGSSISNMPYIFSTGAVKVTNNLTIGSLDSNPKLTGNMVTGGTTKKIDDEYIGNKVNIFCGSLSTIQQSKIAIASNVYCYDENGTSDLKSNGESPLINWIKNQNTNVQYKQNTIDGDFYTKGSVSFSDAGSKLHINSLVAERVLDLSTKNNISIDHAYAHIIRMPDPLVSVTDMTALDNQIKTYLSYSEADKTNSYTCTDVDYDYVIGSDGVCVQKNHTNNTIAKLDAYDYNVLKTTVNNVSQKFPADKELEQILGVNFDTPTHSSSEKLADIVKGDYSITGITSLPNKIIQNPLEMNTRFYVEDPDTHKLVLKGSKSKTGVTGGDTYDNSNIPSEITSECTITGNIDKKIVRIKPGSDISKPLWITLDNVGLLESSFIIEDLAKDASGNFKKDSNGKYIKNAPVYFYIKDGTNFTMMNASKSRIMTEYYEKNYFTPAGGANSLTSVLDIVTNPPVEYIPGVYIYGNNDEGHADGKYEKISLYNNAVITGYIIAPRAQLIIGDAGTTGKNVIYNGLEFKGVSVGVIGSIIAGDINPAGCNANPNNFTLVYINDKGAGNPSDPKEYFGYSRIPGYSRY